MPNTNVPITYWTEEQAAAFLAVAPDTLRVWRNKSRRAGHLIGPRWIEGGGEGRARLIRYRPDDLIQFLEAGMVRLAPKKKVGRPRKYTSELGR